MQMAKRPRLTAEGEIDFGQDGGAYPDIHVDQFPHGIGKMGDKVRGKGIHTFTLLPKHWRLPAVIRTMLPSLGEAMCCTNTNIHIHRGGDEWLFMFRAAAVSSRRCSRIIISVHVMETCALRGEVKFRITNHGAVKLTSSPSSEVWHWR